MKQQILQSALDELRGKLLAKHHAADMLTFDIMNGVVSTDSQLGDAYETDIEFENTYLEILRDDKYKIF